jgi:heme/copper-type cytochrome/quinol oxidase subunit 2
LGAPITGRSRRQSARRDPGDPRAGRRRGSSGDLHLPIGKPVKVHLRSLDVLHDFYVPEFRAKMDMIPGSVTYFWFTPTRTGTFEVLCAELCGTGHPQMRGCGRRR